MSPLEDARSWRTRGPVFRTLASDTTNVASTTGGTPALLFISAAKLVRAWGLTGMIVHLLEYRVATGHDAEVDSFVRHSALRAPPAPGILERCVGRRLGPVGHEHVAATEWRDLDSYGRGTADDGIPEYLASVSALLRDVRSTRYRVVASEGPGLESARILRIYHATVATEMLATWGRQAVGPIDRLLLIAGMEKVIAGVGVLDVDRPGETSIVAITAWRDWDAILRATGGHTDRLLLETELADIERPSDVAHYQLPGLKD